MPELPEVQTISAQLNTKLRGKTVTAVNVLNPGSFIGPSNILIGETVLSVARKAKTLIISFDNDLFVLIHLKMTGQLIYVDGEKRVAGGHPSHDFHDNLPNKHTRVVFDFGNTLHLYFNDLRKFGWCRIVNRAEMDQYFAKTGPDATPLVDPDYLLSRAERMPKSSIKKFLLDQNVIAGIGNIYADEILYELKIHPETLVSSLDSGDWVRISEMADQKLRFAIEKGGTSDSDYLNANGEKGGMQDYLNVYHKTGSPCPRDCGGMVERIKVAGRGTHYCPVCQKVKS